MTASPARRTSRLSFESLDDRCVPATLSINDITLTEGTSGSQNAVLTVTLSETQKRPVFVDFYTQNNSATAGSDYGATSGKLTFSKNQTQKTIIVPVYGDNVAEISESFYVTLSNPKGATIDDGTGVVTIMDAMPFVTIDQAFGYEGDVLTFTVSLSAPLTTTFTVDFTTLDYDAYAGTDYVATSGTLTFAPGVTSQTFTVEILADAEEEFDEYFLIDLSNASSNLVIYNYGYGYIYGEWGYPWW